MSGTKALKQENEALKLEIQRLHEQMVTLTERVDRRLASPEVEPRDVQFLSDKYDDLLSFRKVVETELKQFKANLTSVADKVDKIAAAIDAVEQYSYQYNLKIVGLPQTSERETVEDTAILCLKVFQAMGVVGVSLQDIDTAHRVPRRRRVEDNRTNNNPVICKFTRGLAKDAVMSKRKEIHKVSGSTLGLDHDLTLDGLGIYHHLTPRLQDLLFEARKFKTNQGFKYCWAKATSIYLRENDNSRVIKLQSLNDLGIIMAQHQHR